MSTDTFELPNTYAFGKVIGRIIYAIADTSEDIDDKPQARAASGKVVFTPQSTGAKVVSADYTAIVMNGSTSANLSSSGRLLDAEGRQGVWLITGIYKVSFTFTPTSDGLRGTLPDFFIEVTEEHTEENPLDLAVAAPAVIPTGAVVQTLVVPAGGTEGQILVRNASGGLNWANYTEPDNAVDSVNGLTGTVELDAAAVGALPEDWQPAVADIDATGTADNTTFLRGDGQWVTPPDTDTTYSLISQADAENDASTTAGLVSGQRLAQAVTAHEAVHSVNGETGDIALTADDVGARADSWEPSVSDINATGTPDSTTYLRGDGTWSTPAGGGGGAVDSVNGETGVVVLTAADVGALSSVSYDDLPMGSTFVVRWDTDHWESADGSTIITRPTARTDLIMLCITTGTTPPGFAIDGVDMLLRIGT